MEHDYNTTESVPSKRQIYKQYMKKCVKDKTGESIIRQFGFFGTNSIAAGHMLISFAGFLTDIENEQDTFILFILIRTAKYGWMCFIRPVCQHRA